MTLLYLDTDTTAFCCNWLLFQIFCCLVVGVVIGGDGSVAVCVVGGVGFVASVWVVA